MTAAIIFNILRWFIYTGIYLHKFVNIGTIQDIIFSSHGKEFYKYYLVYICTLTSTKASCLKWVQVIFKEWQVKSQLALLAESPFPIFSCEEANQTHG